MRPRVHLIIEHLGDLVVDASRNGTEFNLFLFSFETVERWYLEAAEYSPTETGIIHNPDLSSFLHRIPAENHWWAPIQNNIGAHSVSCS